ncbi:unnamed protein product [Merluccius merluccius]
MMARAWWPLRFALAPRAVRPGSRSGTTPLPETTWRYAERHMEAAVQEQTPPQTYTHDSGLRAKLLLPPEKRDPKRDPTEPDEPHYVDLVDMKPDECTRTGEVDPAVERGGGGGAPLQKAHDARSCGASVCGASDDLEYTDMYLNSKTVSDEEEEDQEEDDDEDEDDDDDEEVLLSEDLRASDRAQEEDEESHYITTHEIQLTELDHDVDYELGGRGGGGEGGDDNLVYTFVDYALFESDETRGGGGGGGGSDASSDESVVRKSGAPCVKNHHQERLVHLSIKPPPRRTEDGYDAVSAFRRGGGRFLTRLNPRGGCGGDGDDFIPAPGRQHLATTTRLRWRDVHSTSGASSSVSELDDADKEVRSLTARTFRSLACPYFDAIHLSESSSQSSVVSESCGGGGGLGLNKKWAAYVNVNHDASQQQQQPQRRGGGGRGVFTHGRSSGGTFAPSKADADGGGTKGAQTGTGTCATTTHRNVSVSGRAASSPQWDDVITLTKTINIHVEADLPESSRRHSQCAHYAQGGGGPRVMGEAAHGGAPPKRCATLASSHLKNVISKKMQFEQERTLERGGRGARNPQCAQCRGEQGGRMRRQSSSGSGSEVTVYSLEEVGFEGVRPRSSCETAEERRHTKSGVDKVQRLPEREGVGEPKAQLNHSQCSAFTLLKGEPEPQKEHQGLHATAAKEKDFEKQDLSGAASGQKPGTDRRAGDEKVAKPPEIKIRLRSAKENKGHVLNIANLLTPKISNTVKTLKTAGCSRLQVLSAPDRIPHFTVRDVREGKCQFQTPIYHVRDVRKLVKSSYSFVSADDSDNKCPTSAAAAAAAAAEACDDTSKKDSIKHVSPSPIFIKCNSVKTNGQRPPATTAESSPQKPPEASGFTPKGECPSSHRPAHRGTPAVARPLHADQQRPERPAAAVAAAGDAGERKNDPKVPNQAALEKLQAAVKTMEQLYVFDRNEWRRKGRAPQLVSNSHVLSLIASEEHGDEEIVSTATGGGRGRGGRDTPNLRTWTYRQKSEVHLDHSKTIPVSVRGPQDQDPPPGALSRAPRALKSAPKTPQSPTTAVPEDGRRADRAAVTPSNADAGNYLTIPGQGYAREIKLLQTPNAAGDSAAAAAKPKTGECSQTDPLVLECPPATIYHHSHRRRRQHRPARRRRPPAPAPTQRKMLLDITTGYYYLVDTPLQPATKRLFDPQTGAFLDVPVSHSPVAPIPLSPLTLGPGAYAPTYMIYPPSGLIPPSPVQTPHAETPAGNTSGPPIPPIPPPSSSSSSPGKPGRQHEAGAAAAESPYYSATGEGTHAHAPAHTHTAVAAAMVGHVTGGGRGGGTAAAAAAAADRKPVISITTQQGPRIIAPPSFDGTTMSFVVEHR